MIINGIDFDARLEEARRQLHRNIPFLWEVCRMSKYYNPKIMMETNPYSMIQWFEQNRDAIFGIPKQK